VYRTVGNASQRFHLGGGHDRVDVATKGAAGSGHGQAERYNASAVHVLRLHGPSSHDQLGHDYGVIDHDRRAAGVQLVLEGKDQQEVANAVAYRTDGDDIQYDPVPGDHHRARL